MAGSVGSNVKDGSTSKGGGDINVEEKLSLSSSSSSSSVFGRYSEEQLVNQLKSLALDPCHPEYDRNNVRPLWNQIIRIRKAMALADQQFPRRKRQLPQFVKEKLITHPGSKSASPSLPNHTKLPRGLVSHASSKSCLLNSVLSAESVNRKFCSESRSSNSLLTIDGKFQMKQISNGTKRTSIGKDMPYFVDSDESVNYSNPPLNLDEITHTSNSKVVKKRNQKHLTPVQLSSSLSKLIGDHLRKMTVPVGPRFQADVPEWTDTGHNKSTDPKALRWLGTKIWPPEANNTPKLKARGAVGKGRPERCSCNAPKSVECIKRHVLEGTLNLQRDLGTVFYSWKFDEIGEQVSKKWKLQEQQKFESLVAKMKESSDEENFLKNALKCFPQKCRKTIVNYYFNVYIPRRMSRQRTSSSSLKEVDSDGDDVEDCNVSNKSKNSKNGKTKKYLRKPS